MVVNDDAGNLTPLRRPKVHREQVFMQAIKSPTTSSGGMARQAGKTVLADLTLGIRQSVHNFPLGSASVAR
jgi:hypothetical protein